MKEQGQQVSGRVFVTEAIGSVIVSKGKGAHGRVEVVVFSHAEGEVLGRSDVVTLLDDGEPWQTIPLREPITGRAMAASVFLLAECEEPGGFGEGAVGVLCAGSVQQVAAAALESAGAREVQVARGVARGYGGGAWGVKWTGQDGSDCHLIGPDFAVLLKGCVHAEMARAVRLGALRETLARAKARGDLGVVSTPYREGSLMEAMFGGHPLPPAPHLDEVADVLRRADSVRDASEPEPAFKVGDRVRWHESEAFEGTAVAGPVSEASLRLMTGGPRVGDFRVQWDESPTSPVWHRPGSLVRIADAPPDPHGLPCPVCRAMDCDAHAGRLVVQRPPATPETEAAAESLRGLVDREMERRHTVRECDLAVDFYRSMSLRTDMGYLLSSIQDGEPDLLTMDDPHTTTLGGDMTPEAEDRGVYHDTQEDFVEAVCAAIRERYPDTCHVCGGACYKGASVVAEGWEHPVEGTCPPVEAEPEVVSRTTHEMRGEPGCGEWVWQAYGSGVHVKHPLRSGAITAWREALREKGA